LGTRPGGGVFCVKVHVVLFDGQGCEAVGSLSFVPQALLYCRSVKVLWACGDGLLSWLRDSHLSLEVVVMVGGLYMHSAIGCGRVVCCLRPFGWVYVFWFSVVRGWHRHELIVFRVFGRGGMRRFCSG
jgi:hypothetical protein